MVSIVSNAGLSDMVAPAVLAARSIVGAPVNLVAGVITDMIGSKAVLASSFLVQVAGIYALMNLDSAHPHQAWVAGGLLGAASALCNIGLSTLIPDSFGK